MFLRYNYIKDMIDASKMRLYYTSPMDVTADALTKLLTGKLFSETRALLLNSNLDTLDNN
jgi:hypothetical protein